MPKTRQKNFEEENEINVFFHTKNDKSFVVNESKICKKILSDITLDNCD